MVPRTDLRCKRNCLLHGQANPVLAGIDVKGATAAPLMGCNESIPFSHFDHAVYDWPRIKVCESRRRPGVQPMKNINCLARSNCADALGFRKIGYEKTLASGFRQCTHDRINATAISISLDHAGTFNLSMLAEAFPIGCNGCQINFQNAAGLRFRRAIESHAGRKAFVVNDETASSIDDFSINRTFDDHRRTRFNGQIAAEISSNV